VLPEHFWNEGGGGGRALAGPSVAPPVHMVIALIHYTLILECYAEKQTLVAMFWCWDARGI
jgi:hypothetical protein